MALLRNECRLRRRWAKESQLATSVKGRCWRRRQVVGHWQGQGMRSSDRPSSRSQLLEIPKRIQWGIRVLSRQGNEGKQKVRPSMSCEMTQREPVKRDKTKNGKKYNISSRRSQRCHETRFRKVDRSSGLFYLSFMRELPAGYRKRSAPWVIKHWSKAFWIRDAYSLTNSKDIRRWEEM